MLSSSKAIVLALSLLGVASASPLAPRDNPTPPGTCRPNFQGADLLVTNRANPGFSGSDPEFHFQFTGQPTNTFVIRPIDAVDKVVAASGTSPGSGLDIVDIDFNSADPLQLWNVLCEQCGDPSAANSPFTTGCSISLATNNLCVQLDSAQPNPLSVELCTGGDNQKFDFSTV